MTFDEKKAKLKARNEVLAKMTRQQRVALEYVHRNETEDFGVIIAAVTATSLLRKKLVANATRRKFAREGGTCVRLTDAGYAMVRHIDGHLP
jgi:hypothetical protein